MGCYQVRVPDVLEEKMSVAEADVNALKLVVLDTILHDEINVDLNTAVQAKSYANLSPLAGLFVTDGRRDELY